MDRSTGRVAWSVRGLAPDTTWPRGGDAGPAGLLREGPRLGCWLSSADEGPALGPVCSSSEKAPCSFVTAEPEEGTMMVGFDEVVEKVTDAVRHVEADAGASPVLVAVVG